MPRQIFLIAALLFGARCSAAEIPAAGEKPAVVFAGYGNFFGHLAFVIFDPARGESSPWMSLSQNWRGYDFVRFESKRETLTLRSGPREFVLNLKPSKVTEAFLRPRLFKGNYTIVDDRIVYSADAQLRVGEGIVVSAADGVMIANLDQTTISGNLRFMQVGKPVMEMFEAVLDMNDGKFDARAKRMRSEMISSELPVQAH